MALEYSFRCSRRFSQETTSPGPGERPLPAEAQETWASGSLGALGCQKNPPGFLLKTITSGWRNPKGWESCRLLELREWHSVFLALILLPSNLLLAAVRDTHRAWRNTSCYLTSPLLFFTLSCSDPPDRALRGAGMCPWCQLWLEAAPRLMPALERGWLELCDCDKAL